MTKQDLRTIIKQKRDSIPLQIRQSKSDMICQQLFALPEFNRDMTCLNVMSFLSFSSEVITEQIHQKLWQKKANIYLPRVLSLKERTMDIVLYTKNTDLLPSNYGILEPVNSPVISAEDLDIIIVPALAFSENGVRLGYGGGFYDSILNKTQKHCFTVGICFAEQVVDSIPTETHDEKVAKVIFY